MKCDMCGMMMKDEGEMRMHMDMMRGMMMHMMRMIEMGMEMPMENMEKTGAGEMKSAMKRRT